MYWTALIALYLLSPSRSSAHSTEAHGTSIDPCAGNATRNVTRMYTNCKRLRLRLDDSIASNTSVQALLEHYLSDAMVALVQVISIEYSEAFSVERVGKLSDAFLQRRPNWMVYQEEYAWQKHRSRHAMFIRIGGPLDTTLQQMASALNPSNCSAHPLVFKGYHDFDEYGNEHSNIGQYYNTVKGTISLIHIAEKAKFIDPNYCPNELNKHNCAFLPLTHCPLPRHYLTCKNLSKECTPGLFIYSHASLNATLITNDFNNYSLSQVLTPFEPEYSAISTKSYLSRAPLNFTNIDIEYTTSEYLLIGSIFFTSIFLRRNFDFRSRTARLIQRFRRKSVPVFSANDQCIAIHIRHHDRVKPGHDMIKYCNEFVRKPDGSCYNRTNNQPIKDDCDTQFSNYGCGAAIPIGGISFADYLKAAELLMDNPLSGQNVSKNKPITGQNASRIVFIMTDDGEWVKRESQPFLHNWTIHMLPAQPRHRTSGTIHGATLFASMELVQQCSGLVGHSVSAFTSLLRAIMCVKHGPRNNIQFGICPKFYDFAYVSSHNSNQAQQQQAPSFSKRVAARIRQVLRSFGIPYI